MIRTILPYKSCSFFVGSTARPPWSLSLSLSLSLSVRAISILRSRRKRAGYTKYPLEEFRMQVPSAYGMTEPFKPGEETLEDYLKKASLSPWAPLPEVAFRKYFDLAQAEPHDVHVDLGCGDGRVNFHAADNVGIAKSIGIDIDEAVLEVALNRLRKRHPPPTNLEFYRADLMDARHQVWQKVGDATIITMFFAYEALKRFRPILEQKLSDKTCKVLTAGYPMPHWKPFLSEVVLGTQIYLYKWGEADITNELSYEDDEDSDDDEEEENRPVFRYQEDEKGNKIRVQVDPRINPLTGKRENMDPAYLTPEGRERLFWESREKDDDDPLPDSGDVEAAKKWLGDYSEEEDDSVDAYDDDNAQDQSETQEEHPNDSEWTLTKKVKKEGLSPLIKEHWSTKHNPNKP